MSRCYLIDTNVVVAGLLASQADSAIARVFDGMLQAVFPFVLSPLLLAEYRAVLLRPEIQKAQGLTPDQVDTVLTDVALAGFLVDPEPGLSSVRAPDPGDPFLWNLLEQRPGLELVTGDLRLSQDPAMRPRVITPPSADRPNLARRSAFLMADNFCRRQGCGQKLSVASGTTGHKSSPVTGKA